jgi:type I restriction enzyme, R subunit
LFTSLANRLTRLDKQITEKEKKQFAEKANGKSVSQVVKELLNAFNPDVLEEIESKVRTEMAGAAPVEIEAEIKAKTENYRTKLPKYLQEN